MMTINAGALALHRATRPQVTVSQLSKMTGIGRPRIKRLIGGAVPDAREMDLLKGALDIPLEAWTSEEPVPPGFITNDEDA